MPPDLALLVSLADKGIFGLLNGTIIALVFVVVVFGITITLILSKGLRFLRHINSEQIRLLSVIAKDSKTDDESGTSEATDAEE